MGDEFCPSPPLQGRLFNVQELSDGGFVEVDFIRCDPVVLGNTRSQRRGPGNACGIGATPQIVRIALSHAAPPFGADSGAGNAGVSTVSASIASSSYPPIRSMIICGGPCGASPCSCIVFVGVPAVSWTANSLAGENPVVQLDFPLRFHDGRTALLRYLSPLHLHLFE